MTGLQRDERSFSITIHAQVAWERLLENERMTRSSSSTLTPAKRKRLLKAYGPCPAGYTHDDLECLLDLLYGLFDDLYTVTELRQIVVSDPFDRTEHPRQLKLVELSDWLEALLS